MSISPRSIDEALAKFQQVSQKGDKQHAVDVIRRMILMVGIPDATARELRPRIWKMFLLVNKVSATDYLALIKKQKVVAEDYIQIRKDAYRTFRNSEAFWGTSAQDRDGRLRALVRIANSFIHEQEGRFSYCQGMNVLGAIFLSCMTEMDAFYAFSAFVSVRCPIYWKRQHIGVEAAAKLVDQTLLIADRTLALHLKKCGVDARIYAFACLQSFSSCAEDVQTNIQSPNHEKLAALLTPSTPHAPTLPLAADATPFTRRSAPSSASKGDTPISPISPVGDDLTVSHNYNGLVQPQPTATTGFGSISAMPMSNRVPPPLLTQTTPPPFQSLPPSSGLNPISHSPDSASAAPRLSMSDGAMSDILDEDDLKGGKGKVTATPEAFNEVIKLWDFLLAFGPHLHVVCVVAQLIALRSKLLSSNSPTSIVNGRLWPSFKARHVISLTMSIVSQLPPALYNDVCQHLVDMKTAERLTGRTGAS